MIPARPFDIDYPYQLGEDSHSTLQVVRHTLDVMADLTGGMPGTTVTLSRESLAVLTGHLSALLQQAV